MNPPLLSIRGIFRDVLLDPRGGVLHDSGWTSNTIVTRCRILLSAFMKNDPETETAFGIQHLAVGRGEEGWDEAGVPPPDPEETTGLTEPFEEPIPRGDLEIAYLDSSDGVQSDPSPRLQITATLEPGYPAPLEGLSTYPLREFGLFGRLGGADHMINCIRHPVIHKDESATLIRVVRLYF
jgi:hypothetical protein